MAKQVAGRRVLTLIRRYLETGIIVEGVVAERHEGTPQGGPLSPLLANVLLDDVDKELERRGLRFVRERSFLGFSFWRAPGKIVKRRVAPKALKKMKERVRAITARTGGGRTTYRELRRHGVGGRFVAITARYTRHWWRASKFGAMHLAFPGAYFESLGVSRLGTRSPSKAGLELNRASCDGPIM